MIPLANCFLPTSMDNLSVQTAAQTVTTQATWQPTKSDVMSSMIAVLGKQE